MRDSTFVCNLKNTMAENKDEMDHLSDDRRQNPYATPVDYEPDKILKSDGRSTLAIVVLAILIVPAAFIAGFTACTGTFFATSWLGDMSFMLGFIVGGVVAILVFTLIFRRILTIGKNRHLPR